MQNIKNNSSITNLLLTLHAYLGIFIVLAVIFFVFLFYDYQAISDLAVRPYTFLITVDGSDHQALADREGKDRLAYALSAILVPIILFFSLFLSQKYLVPSLLKIEKERLKFLSNLIAITSFFFIAIGIILTFLTLELLVQNTTFATIEFWQKIQLYSSSLTIITALIFAYLAIIYDVFGNKKLQKITSIIFIISAAALILFIGSYSFFNESVAVNFSPVVYPIVQTFLGKAPLFDLKSLYGLHPYFLQIFLYISPSILCLKVMMALMFLTAGASIAFFIFSVIENKLVALMGFLTFLYIQNFSNNTWPDSSDIIFQYEYIRLFFPALLLSFLYLFFKKPSNSKYYLGLVIFSIATIWNLDVGVPSFIVFVAMSGYKKFVIDAKKPLIDIVQFSQHLAKSFGILASIWLVFFLILRLKYGQWPDISYLFYGQKAAVGFGYAMINIPAFGAWYILVMIYIIGYVFSIYNFVTKNHSLQNYFILTLTILGTGLFSYFVGRSHYSNLLHCGYPAVILLVIFADKFCKNFHKKDFVKFFPKIKSESLISILPLLIIAYFSSAFWFNLFSYNTLKENFILNEAASVKERRAYREQEAEFIKKYIGDSDKVREDLLMLAINDQDYYFSLKLLEKSPLKIANLRHMFYIEDLNAIYLEIANKSKKWVVVVESSDVARIISRQERSYLGDLLLKHYKLVGKEKFGDYDSVLIYEK